MRKIILLAAMLAVGCQFKDSYPYYGDECINFSTDSVYVSFGAVPFSVHDTTVTIKAEIVGSPAITERTYRIFISEQSTATAGKEYDAVPEEHILASGAASDEIAISVHRLEMDLDSVYVLRLQMLPTEDFALGIAEYQNISVAFTNRLDCPDWWLALSSWLGEWDVRKYQKFIELYGRTITSADIRDNRYGILRVFKDVKTYFESNPEFGVSFPDTHWIV